LDDVYVPSQESEHSWMDIHFASVSMIFWFRLWNSSDGVVFSGLDYGTLLMVWYFLV
jgi:hypothetical protein